MAEIENNLTDAQEKNQEKAKKIHPLYQRIAYSRQQMRDTVEGSVAVKRRSTNYLPMPAAFNLNSTEASFSEMTAGNRDHKKNKNSFGYEFDAPWRHSNPAYQLYLHLARFPDVTAKSLEGLVGIATRKEPDFKLPPALEYLEENATADGLGLTELYNYCIHEVLSQGKVALVVDVNEKTNQLTIVPYLAESNTNWKYCMVDGKKLLKEAILVEVDDSSSDKNYFMYELVEEEKGKHVAYVKKCDSDFIDAEDYSEDCGKPLVRIGKRANKIPIFFIGSKTNDAGCDHIPMLGISDIALMIYQKDADLSHAENLTCNPTLFLFGFDDSNKPKAVGSGVAVTNSNPQAHAEYTQTDTSGLDHVQSRINAGYDEAASYGATIIGATVQRNEKFETARLRNSGVSSTLVTVVDNVSRAIEECIRFMAEWVGSANTQEYFFEGNTDFTEHSLSAQELTALLSMWISNAISQDTLLYNMQRAGKLEDGVNVDDEKARIQNEMEDMVANEIKQNKEIKNAEGDNAAGELEDETHKGQKKINH